jgi:hypothetical protein
MDVVLAAKCFAFVLLIVPAFVERRGNFCEFKQTRAVQLSKFFGKIC